MSDFGSRFGPFGAGPSDSVGGLLASMAEMWGRGFTAWQALARGGTEGGWRGEQMASSLGAMLRPIAEIAATVGAAFPRGEAPGVGSEAGPAQPADMSFAMAQALAIAAGSTMRYWQALADLHARYQASLMRVVADRATGQSAASPIEYRELADELRAFLREVGDAAALEARRLQLELEQVGEAVARVADQATPPPDGQPYRRQHRVKE